MSAADTEHDEEIATLLATLRAENDLSGHSELWLVSYADLMTLLFGFFAMLYLLHGKLETAPEPPKPPTMAQRLVIPTLAMEDLPPLPPKQRVGPLAKPDESSTHAAPQGHGEKSAADGGNAGFRLPPFPAELLFIFAIASFLYVCLYVMGVRRRRREIVPVGRAAGMPPPPPLRVRQALAAAAAASMITDTTILDLADAEEDEEIDDSGLSHGPALTDERWLISYADLMTLLFGFFAMLYLMGENFDLIQKSMENTFTKKPPSAAERLVMPKDYTTEDLENLLNTAAPAVVTPPPPAATDGVPVPPPLPVTTAAEVKPPPVATSTEITPLPITSATAVAPPTATATHAAPTPKVSLRDMEEEQVRNLRERLSKRGGVKLERAAEGGADDGTGGGKATGEGTGNGDGTGSGNGYGGSGTGGGRGDNHGAGTTEGDGIASCDSNAQAPFRYNCTGSGYYGCVDPDALTVMGGQNGQKSAVELYCVDGRTRVCLTWERCPWRSGDSRQYGAGLTHTDADPNLMGCSPYGLNISAAGGSAVLAACRSGGNCGFRKIECDHNGNMIVQ